MEKFAVAFNFLFFSFGLLAQPSVEEVNQYIIGAWEGPIPVTGKISNYIKEYPVIHAQFLIDVRLQFNAKDASYKISLLRTREATLIEPKNTNDPTLKNLLNAQRSYEIFMTDNDLETTLFSILPPEEKEPMLNLGLIIKNLNSKGKKLAYLKEDFKKIKIKSITEKKLILSIPSRTGWDSKLNRYTIIKYIDLEFVKGKRP